jgi:hypothetical protein
MAHSNPTPARICKVLDRRSAKKSRVLVSRAAQRLSAQPSREHQPERTPVAVRKDRFGCPGELF